MVMRGITEYETCMIENNIFKNIRTKHSLEHWYRMILSYATGIVCVHASNMESINEVKIVQFISQ